MLALHTTPPPFWGPREYDYTFDGEDESTWTRPSLRYPGLTLVSDSTGLAAAIEVADKVKSQKPHEPDATHAFRHSLLTSLTPETIEGLTDQFATLLGFQLP
ncbi:MAG: hypothetical protein ABUL72_01230 [Armatimonadota bacterium]